MKIGLYADGNYFCKCIHCSETFHGDKRAVHCFRCAAKECQRSLAAANADNEKLKTAMKVISRNGKGGAVTMNWVCEFIDDVLKDDE